MSDKHTEQGVQVYELEPDWIAAKTPQEALDHMHSLLGGGKYGYTMDELREQYGTPEPIDLDAETMMPDPYKSTEERITYREAVKQHLAGKWPEVPTVIASSEY